MTETQQQRLSADELAAIRARADAATPGPWIARHDPPGIVHETNRSFQWWAEEAMLLHEDMADADFIAAARTDVPRLLAHMDALAVDALLLEAALREIIEWCDEPDYPNWDRPDWERVITRARAVLGEMWE